LTQKPMRSDCIYRNVFIASLSQALDLHICRKFRST
jgi:hypothetical protein